MRYKFTRKELKTRKASSFKNQDIIEVNKYRINIVTTKYTSPALQSYTETENYKILDCTPGAGTPYYIDDFLHR